MEQNVDEETVEHIYRRVTGMLVWLKLVSKWDCPGLYNLPLIRELSPSTMVLINLAGPFFK